MNSDRIIQHVRQNFLFFFVEDTIMLSLIYSPVQRDGCEMWIHNECSFITEGEYENVLKSGCNGFVQNVNFSTFRTLSLLIS